MLIIHCLCCEVKVYTTRKIILSQGERIHKNKDFSEDFERESISVVLIFSNHIQSGCNEFVYLSTNFVLRTRYKERYGQGMRFHVTKHISPVNLYKRLVNRFSVHLQTLHVSSVQRGVHRKRSRIRKGHTEIWSKGGSYRGQGSLQEGPS